MEKIGSRANPVELRLESRFVNLKRTWEISTKLAHCIFSTSFDDSETIF